MKRRFVFLATVFAAAALTGCAAETPPPQQEESGKQEIPYTPAETERYQNPIEIEGQWGVSIATGPEGYGIGDPFVMRFNGKYYLYPSTSDLDDGIKVFESEDLIHWTDKGYAVAQSEKTVHGAYAPEVVYYRGYFYLCQSRGGQGHYIYRSESPTEGFELVSKTDGMTEGALENGNLGMGIDGSFYVSDDGRLFLLHTSSPAGLKYNEITDTDDIRTATLGKTGVLGEANLRHWIEGPSIFRRGNFSYLTYTGNHVLSRGYRVGYSYAEDLKDLSSFVQPQDNVTIMDTADGHYGLGHSSNVTGPDLDSVYTAYHSLVGRGPARRYNLDRYFASGGVLTANGNTYRPVAVPAQPAAGGYAESLSYRDSIYLLGDTEGFFTAEYNFIPSEEQELFFGKKDGREYVLRLWDGRLVLSRRTESGESVLAEARTEIPEGRLAVVRVENGDGVGYVSFNGMRLLEYDAKSSSGGLGYAAAEGVGYTAFSNDVFGTSDFEAPKNFPAKFPAVTYLKGEMRGFSIADAKRMKGGVRVGEKESTLRVGDGNAVCLSAGDWVKYAVDVEKKAVFSVMAEVTPDSAGAEIELSVGAHTLRATLPEVGTENETVRVYLGDVTAPAGVTSMKVSVLSGEAKFVLFEAYEKEEGDTALGAYRALSGNVSFAGGTLVLDGGSGMAAAVWENTAVTDFRATLRLSCKVDTASDFGLMIRAAHYSVYPDQPTQSWRGYYLQIASSVLSLSRYDYGDFGSYGAVRTDGIDLGTEGVHTVSVEARGNRFTVQLDGVTLAAEDDRPFFGGGLGVFVRSGALSVLSLEFEPLSE